MPARIRADFRRCNPSHLQALPRRATPNSSPDLRPLTSEGEGASAGGLRFRLRSDAMPSVDDLKRTMPSVDDLKRDPPRCTQHHRPRRCRKPPLPITFPVVSPDTTGIVRSCACRRCISSRPISTAACRVSASGSGEQVHPLGARRTEALNKICIHEFVVVSRSRLGAWRVLTPSPNGLGSPSLAVLTSRCLKLRTRHASGNGIEDPQVGQMVNFRRGPFSAFLTDIVGALQDVLAPFVPKGRAEIPTSDKLRHD